MTSQAPRAIADLPSPVGLPLLGDLIPFAGSRRHQVIEKWCDELGPTFRIRVPGDVVVTADPKMVDTLLRDRPDDFRRSTRVTGVIDELRAHGVFTAEGDHWRRLRRAATRSMSSAYLNTYFSTLTRSTERLRRRWRAAADVGTSVDVLGDLMRYTLDTTVGLSLGHDLNALEKEGDGLHRRLPEIFPEIARRAGSPVPYWRWLRLPRHRRIAATIDELDALLAERYAEAQRVMATGASPSNFLEALVEPMEDETALTRPELLGNVLTMLLAGEDTTATTAAWTIYHMAADPEVHRKVREEADAVLGEQTVATDPGLLRRLTYTEAVVHEATRIRPVTALIAVQPLRDVVLEGTDGALSVPAGTPIFVLLTRGSRDATRFPDPEVFRPERWLDGGPGPAGPDVMPFLPFGGGPRFCPGRNLALIETRLVAAMAAAEFDLRPDTSNGPVTERSAFTVFPENMWVSLENR